MCSRRSSQIENAFGLVAAAFADGEQPRQPSPGGAVLRIGEDVRRAVGENEPRAGRDLQLCSSCCRRHLPRGGGMRAHDAGDRIAIGNAEAGQSEFDGVLDQFLRMRAAAQEGEIGGDGELGIGGRRHIRGFGARFRLAQETDGYCSCEHAVQEPGRRRTPLRTSSKSLRGRARPARRRGSRPGNNRASAHGRARRATIPWRCARGLRHARPCSARAAR